MISTEQLNQLTDAPADLIPWAYIWRRDRKTQEKPEANFIPRIIKRQDEVYRTLLPALGKDAGSLSYKNQLDTLTPQLPQATGELLTCALSSPITGLI